MSFWSDFFQKISVKKPTYVPVQPLAGKQYFSALELVVEKISGKWRVLILWQLGAKKKRFGELRREIPKITERSLSLQLQQLADLGLIQRKVFAESPPKVEYSLTEEGKSLLPVIEKMVEWGEKRWKEQPAIK